MFLPSGGSLVIDRTEAMTVIDVNTGKFTGSGGNLEATVTSNNLEAAEEIVRQLRLRDIGGIIVIDFIDMVLPANRELLLRRLVECLGRDRTRHQVAEVTSLGLVQMTRKKIGTGLLEAFSSECPVCHGRGYEIHEEPVDSQRQADGGAREQRGGRRDGSSGSGGTSNGSTAVVVTATARRGHDHGSNGDAGTARAAPAGAVAAAVAAGPTTAPSPRRRRRDLAAPTRRSRPPSSTRSPRWQPPRGPRATRPPTDPHRRRRRRGPVGRLRGGGADPADQARASTWRSRCWTGCRCRSGWCATASRPTTRRSAPSEAPWSASSTRPG